MLYTDLNGLLAYQSLLLTAQVGVTHAVFTRVGGLSKAPYNTLNIGVTVGDKRAHVTQNLKRMAKMLGTDVKNIATTRQVHGHHVVAVSQPTPNESIPEGDAIITDVPHLPLLMRFADCVPILFFEPKARVVGIAHAGWRGTVAKIAAKTVYAMVEQYDANPRTITAVIGPSIGPNDYEVGEEIKTEFEDAFGERTAAALFSYPNGDTSNPYLDLWAANRMLLEECGLSQIETANISTASNTDLYFSHRAEYGKTGRFGAMIMLL